MTGDTCLAPIARGDESDVQSTVREVLHSAGTPLHHGDGTLDVKVKVIDLRWTPEAIGIDMQEVDAPPAGRMAARDDERRARHRTAHTETLAEAAGECRLAGPEVAREHDEVTSPHMTGDSTTPGLRGLAVVQVDALLRHQLTRSTSARRCLLTSSTASRVSMCPTPGRITSSADGVWRTIS